MARPKAVRPSVRKQIRIDEEILMKAELALYSDIKGQVPYGLFNALIESLLLNWLKHQASKPQTMKAD